jgi:photosystem II stability/assembly factor-like uncharacterized protein
MTLYTGVFCGGVFKTTNGGANWTATNSGLSNNCVQSLAVDPKNSANVYVGTNTGVFKSTDGGATWSASTYGLPAVGGVSLLRIDPNTPAIIYAGMAGGGVFKSMDAGATWQPTGN